jgi:anti-sigma factor RsiW
MSCERLEGKIIAYIDGRAGESERRSLEQHLEHCTACSARVRGFRRVWGELDELPQHEPSAAFDARLRARLEAEPLRQSIWSWLLPAPRFALAVMLLAVFGLWISSRAPAPPPAAPANPAQATNDDFEMIKNLQVLENYDVLSNFDVLSQLPAQPTGAGNSN